MRFAQSILKVCLAGGEKIKHLSERANQRSGFWENLVHLGWEKTLDLLLITHFQRLMSSNHIWHSLCDKKLPSSFLRRKHLSQLLECLHLPPNSRHRHKFESYFCKNKSGLKGLQCGLEAQPGLSQPLRPSPWEMGITSSEPHIRTSGHIRREDCGKGVWLQFCH